MSLNAPSAPASLDYSTGRTPAPNAAHVRRPGRLAVTVTLLLALFASGALQEMNEGQRAELTSRAGSTANVGSLNSYSLALLLGGLRGPLVMYLWSSSENQKHDKDLDDLDTKIELIRLLEPEFDSVHLFQMWNKAYNVSVLMSSLSNKYSVIIDAIEYGHKVDEARPDNINIVAAIADLYFNKLASSAEQEYYTKRVMEDTRWREAGRPGTGAGRGDSYIRKTRLDPMLDPAGNILPALLQHRHDCPPGTTDEECNDGSELQHLQKFAPFPYGIAPVALGYNYYKRAQLLMSLTHQHHTQLSDQVIDSRPAITLKGWSEGEYNLGMRLEIQAYGQPVPGDYYGNRGIICVPTEALGPDLRPDDAGPLKEAIYHLRMTIRTADEAAREYARHLAHRTNNLFIYRTHLEELNGRKHIAEADALYLEAVLAGEGEQRRQKLAASRESYGAAAALWRMMIVKHGITEQSAAKVFPPGITKANVDTLGPDAIARVVDAYYPIVAANPSGQGQDEAVEFFYYLQRATRRVDVINATIGSKG